MVLRRTGLGRLVLKGCQLFPPGAEAGDSQPFAIRCEPSDQYGTAFAVVAHEQVRRFELVSVKSALLPPCSYQLTAELRRPGLVRFRGLPAELHADPRSWPELVAAVPPQFETPEPAHLICAIEVSGPGKQVLERIDRIEQLIRHVANDADGRLLVSVISYGPHSFDRSAPEVPTSILSWAAPGTMALAELDRLRQRGPAEIGYPRAAQLECMLTELAGLLAPQDGRPVLVTAGSRPAFPVRVDPRTEIIPCPRRHDWRQAIRRLREHAGIAFGAIHDRSLDGEIWSQLGSAAFTPAEAVDVPRFAAKLGFRTSADCSVPFPLTETGGS